MHRILLVDDEAVVLEVLASLLEEPEREIVCARNGTEALAAARAGELAVALVDKNLGSESGLDLARQLKTASPDIEILLITGYASIESAIEAVQIGAFDYLTKPITDFGALGLKVQSAVEKSGLKKGQRALLERLVESEVRHRRLIDALPDAMVLHDRDTGLIVEANRAAISLYGYPAPELIGMPVSALRAAGSEGTPGPRPTLQRHRRKDGREIAVEVTFTEYTQQGRTLFAQSARDVSAREQGGLSALIADLERHATSGDAKALRQTLDRIRALTRHLDLAGAA